MFNAFPAPLRRAALALAASAPLSSCILGPHISNIVPNPGFEAGNTGFTSQYQYRAQGDDADQYHIAGTVTPFNSNWPASTVPHSGTAMMIVDGATSPGTIIWASPSLSVRPYTTYYFSLNVTPLFPNSPAVLHIAINGAPIGPDFSATSNVSQWQSACFAWKSGPHTTASISITDQNLDYYGNDFALDDLSFGTIHKCQPIPPSCTPSSANLPPTPQFYPPHPPPLQFYVPRPPPVLAP